MTEQLQIEASGTPRSTRERENGVAKLEAAPSPARASGGLTPLEMLNAAIERGDSLDRLERLMDLNDRWEKAQAKKAFTEAKAAFKANAPTITKDKKNKQYDSTYASIGNVVDTINVALGKFGLDAKWDFDQGDKSVRVTCILTHVQGHSESVTLSAPPDASGNKNPIQQIKSTLTYLKLATFEAVTGIATKEGNADDDGNGAGAQVISDEQADELRTLITATNTQLDKFLEVAKAESVSDVLAKDFERLKQYLVAKQRKINGGKP